MFGKKRKSWYKGVLKALIFAGFMYRVARWFQKWADRAAGEKKGMKNDRKKKEKKAVPAATWVELLKLVRRK